MRFHPTQIHIRINSLGWTRGLRRSCAAAVAFDPSGHSGNDVHDSIRLFFSWYQYVIVCTDGYPFQKNHIQQAARQRAVWNHAKRCSAFFWVAFVCDRMTGKYSSIWRFPKSTPKSCILDWDFHYQPSILGYLNFRKPPYIILSYSSKQWLCIVKSWYRCKSLIVVVLAYTRIILRNHFIIALPMISSIIFVVLFRMSI